MVGDAARVEEDVARGEFPDVAPRPGDAASAEDVDEFVIGVGGLVVRGAGPATSGDDGDVEDDRRPWRRGRDGSGAVRR